MAAVGVVALVLVGIVLLMMLFLLIRSIPDLARYRRLRRM